MRPRGREMFLMLALSLCTLRQAATAQRGAAASQQQQAPCASASLAGPVMVRAAHRGAPYINLCDGHALRARQAAQVEGQPLVLASADFDEEGVPDLVSGYAAGPGGMVTVHRGNVNALWPYGAAVRDGAPEAFLPDARTFDLPERPDFLGVGDFNADGHWDIVAASRGGSALYFLLGDGHGGFSAPQTLGLPGVVTAMTTGEINRADGLTDIVVGISSGRGSQVLVFEAPNGAMRAEPEVINLPSSVTALALGRLDGGAMFDLAVAAGHQLFLVHGRDRMLSLGKMALNNVPPAKIGQQTLSFSVRALAAGSFSGLANLAALGDDGAVHLLENAHAVAHLAKLAGNPAVLRLAGKGKAAVVSATGGRQTRQQALIQLAALRKAALQSSLAAGPGAEWTERDAVALPQSAIATSPQSGFAQLVAARISSSPSDDLLVVDGNASQIHLLANTVARDAAAHDAISAESVAQESMTHLTSFDVSGSPAAVLPMRLNQHPLQSLVLLASGQATPIVAQSTPAITQVVTNTSDSGTGSLRDALTYINSVGEPAAISFNIPLTDPNCDPNTHVCTLYVLSSGPGNCNDWALPAVSAPVTIDGYTQPGANPNTLSSGDNAIVLIRIDGSQTTIPGGEGFSIGNATIRGLNVAGWNNPDTTCKLIMKGSAIGALGIDMEGTGGFAEGNFVGTKADASGSGSYYTGNGLASDANDVGVFVGNGPELGWTVGAGNVVGGTTPQARNVISGNGVGVEVYAEVDLTQIQGNFVGTDRTGTEGVGNQVGVFASEFTTIGGTLPGAGNVISNSTLAANVSMNSSAYGSNNLIQGNFIGTDVTGTKALGGFGVTIIYNYTYATVGGTTPAARNVISGNWGPGIWLDTAWDNLVQGNYIGVDPSGSLAVANTGEAILSDDETFTWAGSTIPVTNVWPAFENPIGGAVARAGNLISGNRKDGISIAGSTWDYEGIPCSSGCGTQEGNVIQGNLIGTDATGTNSIPNGGSGIHLLSGTDATYGTTTAINNVIGGTDEGAGNVVSNNAGHGVLIESGSSNNTVANVIHDNGGAGVRVIAGTGNLISRNSIYGNGALGIDIDTQGENTNSHCQANTNGANKLQNAPVLTAGSGTTYLSATATDPNGNTSEFSNTVNVSGNIFDALGTFDGLPGTTFTIEFFSSPTADPSGFGQGQTYLGSTTVATPASCSAPVSNPIDTSEADVSVSLTQPLGGIYLGPAAGEQVYSSTVTNNGPAIAHNVVWTDQLPSSLVIVNSGQGTCTSPVTTTMGSCTVSGNLVTCDLGTMAAGATATITVPVETETIGTISNTVNVKAKEPDSDLANNTASTTESSSEPFPVTDHLDPAAVIAGSPDLTLMVYGENFLPTTTIQFNGTTLPGIFYDNQTCSYEATPFRCTALQIVVPAALLASPGDARIVATNGTRVGYPDTFSGFIQSSCQYTASVFPGLSVGYDGGFETVYTQTNAPTCSWTASSAVPWISILDLPLAAGGSSTGNAGIGVLFAPDTGASRSGNYTQAGQTLTFQQTGGGTCSYTLDANSVTLPGAAGTGTIGVTPSNPSCIWTAQAIPSWITFTKQPLLTGSGSVAYSVSANPGAPRTGTIVVGTQGGGGTAYTVTQKAASDCYFTLTSSSGTFPTSGGSGSFGVVASQPGCAWTASVDQAFTTITSGSSGTGSGTVKYNVASNSGDGQTATITVGNQAGSFQTFSVNQASANVCAFSLSPNSVNLSNEGGSNTLNLTESYSFCKWTAQSNNPDALLMPSASGTGGNTPLAYTVAQNPGPARVLTATVGCQTFTVHQGAAETGNPVPAITTTQPSSTPAGTTNLTLTVNGTNFVSGATVLFNGLPRTTTYVNSGKVTAAILDRDVDTVGTASVVVTNPVPGGGVSNAISFGITGQNPVPVVTSLQPASVGAGMVGPKGLTLTVLGTKFTTSSVVSFGGTARATSFVSTTQLTIQLLAADAAAPGTFAVVVANPAPGGGPSNSFKFNVTSPLPAITAMSPTSVAAGSGELILSVSGTGFINGSVVNFGGHSQATSFVDEYFLIAVVLPTALDTAGDFNVTVTNPAPGGGTSNALTFKVTGTNPVPTVTTLQPASAMAGGAAFTLTVNGTNFLNSSVVIFNGNPRATTFVSATQLTAAIPASDIVTGGTVGVMVTNPAPGGGTSNAVTFTIKNPSPAITALDPSYGIEGAPAFTLTVHGTGFDSASVVTFNGNAKATTFVSATQLTAAIPAADVATAGSVPVSVANPAPGGGTATAVSFDIKAGTAQLQFTPARLTLVAGSGGPAPGCVGQGDGGPALQATFCTAEAVAPDAAGNLYIADQDGNVVRKIDTSGNISTFAGNPKATVLGDGGPATSAMLNNPIDVVADALGNVYISDYGNGRIRKVDTSGTITTFAGGGNHVWFEAGPAVGISIQPAGITFDPLGNLFIADINQQIIVKIDTAGNATLFAGVVTVSGPGQSGYNGDHILATNAWLNFPNNVASDQAGNIYIADTSNYRVRKVDASTGIITTVAGNGTQGDTGDGGPATSAAITATAVSADLAGDLFISGTDTSHRVRKVDVGGDISNYAGGGSGAVGGPAGTANLAGAYLARVDGNGTLLIPTGKQLLGAGPQGILQFGTQNVHTTSHPMSLTLTNPGDVAISFSSIAGSNFGSGVGVITGDFAIAAGGSCDFSANLAAGATCTLNVTFTPTAAGSRRGTITLSTTAPNTPNVVQLSGTGISSGPAPQTITFPNPGTQTYGVAPITLTATASSGLTVSYSVTSGPVTVSGNKLTITGAGSVTVQATQAGNADYAAATPVSVTFAVNRASQTITFPNPGTQTYGVAPITLTATASSGLTVSYSVTSGPATVSGNKLTITGAGSVTVQATQAGNADYAAATPVSVTFTVNLPAAPDFSVSASPGSQSVSPGGAASYTVTVRSTNGSFGGVVALTVSGLPTGATASFSPAQVTPGDSSATSTLTVQTAAATAVAQSRSLSWTLATPALALMLLLPAGRRRKKPVRKILVTLAILASVVATALVLGCGGGFASGKGFTSYTLTITGASGNGDTHSTSVQLTVQ